MKNSSIQKNIDLVNRYGITLNEFEEMERAQNYVCAICHEPETRVIRGKVCRLHVDHSHKLNKVRKLLCNKCNAMLGLARDNPAILRAAIEYLEQ